MRNIKLTLAYDGSEFHGWQVQPGLPTVQGVVRDALRQITREEVALHGAGRTDAGVHAWGQVASFKTGSQLPPEDFLRALNALLPPSVRVCEAEEAAEDFHARWMATAKTYRYRIYRGAVASPFGWRYALHDPRRADFDSMAEAARLFEGRHDFTSFAASAGSQEDDEERNPVRDVFRSEWLRGYTRPDEPERWPSAGLANGEDWVYLARGRSFLRHMVRKMVGTLLEVGRGRLAPSDILEILERRDRAAGGPTAPPQGLCLVSVEYADVIRLPKTASANAAASS